MRTIGAVAILAGLAATASGQSMSLGGYGGSMRETGPAMSAPVIPYAGRFGGFMPYRMGSAPGGDLSFRPRAASAMASPPRRPAFGLAPMSTGFGTMPSPEPMRMGVMPPSLGYPFRPPTDFGASAGSDVGMAR